MSMQLTLVPFRSLIWHINLVTDKTDTSNTSDPFLCEVCADKLKVIIIIQLTLVGECQWKRPVLFSKVI